jgi:predicted heme/steroid binding protein
VRVFTVEELAQYTGRDGTAAYIAYQGRVYDVTGSLLWRNGRHWVRIQAGQDLTERLKEAPHGEDLLARVPMVGTLAE